MQNPFYEFEFKIHSITECGLIYVHLSIFNQARPQLFEMEISICTSSEVITLRLEFLEWKEMILKTPNNIYYREPACYLVLDKETPLEHFSSVFFPIPSAARRKDL